MEWAFGQSPVNREAGNAAMVSDTVGVSGQNYLTLTFKRRKSEPLLQYIPEVSGDSQIWSSKASAVRLVNVASFDADTEMATYQDLTPVTAATPRFIRLKVIRN